MFSSECSVLASPSNENGNRSKYFFRGLRCKGIVKQNKCVSYIEKKKKKWPNDESMEVLSGGYYMHTKYEIKVCLLYERKYVINV